MLRVVEVDEDSFSNWDSFIASSPCGTIFHSSHWLRALKRAFQFDTRMLAVYSGDDIVGGCTLLSKKKRLFKMAIKPWATLYTGIIFSRDGEQIQEKIIDALQHRLFEEYYYVQMLHPPGVTDIAPFVRRRWETSTRYTYIVDISDLDGLWLKMKSKARTSIRRGDRDKLTLRESVQWDTLFEIYKMVYEGQNLPFGVEAFQTLGSALHDSGMAKLFLTQDREGNVHYALLVGMDDKRAYTLLGGPHSHYRDKGGGSWCFWKIFEYLAGRYTEIDLVGVGTPGISSFKSKFSPRLVPFYETERYAGFSRKLQLKAYHALKGRLG